MSQSSYTQTLFRRTSFYRLRDSVQQPDLSKPLFFLVGGFAARVTPVPIPNTVVKPRRADGTAEETRWESTTSPAFFSRAPSCLCAWWGFHASPNRGNTDTEYAEEPTRNTRKNGRKYAENNTSGMAWFFKLKNGSGMQCGPAGNENADMQDESNSVSSGSTLRVFRVEQRSTVEPAASYTRIARLHERPAIAAEAHRAVQSHERVSQSSVLRCV